MNFFFSFLILINYFCSEDPLCTQVIEVYSLRQELSEMKEKYAKLEAKVKTIEKMTAKMNNSIEKIFAEGQLKQLKIENLEQFESEVVTRILDWPDKNVVYKFSK